MATPAYITRSTAVSSACDPCTLISTSTVTLPSSISAGDILVLVYNANSGFDCVAVGGLSGWTKLYEQGIGASRVTGLYYKVADGTEGSTTVSATMSWSGSIVGLRFLVNVYQFSAGTVDNTVGTSSTGVSITPSFANATTNAANTLLVGVTWVVQNVTMTDTTGETNGDWTEVAAEDTSTANAQSVQSAAIATSGTTVSGGTLTLGSSRQYWTYVFGIEETVAAGSFPFAISPMLTHHIFR